MYRREEVFMKRSIFILLSTFIILFIVGCNGQSTEEKIFNHLEETIVLEQSFEEEQKKINELELKDQELYEEIIQLDLDDFEKIVTLSEEAIEYLDEREEYLQNEKESIEASKDEFLKIEQLIDKLSEENLKKQGEAMYESMINRFNAYDDVYETYSSSIENTKKLYESLQDEDIDEKEIVSLITKVNDSYELVFEANDLFNEETEQYNDHKQKFYELINKESE